MGILFARRPSGLSVLFSMVLAAVAGVESAFTSDFPFQALTAPHAQNADTVELGRKLFNDPRLSKTGTVSCSSCHNLASGGVDHLVFSRGEGGQIGDVNSPTVFNSSLNFRQFWNGRADSLEEQAAGPILNPKEMASSWDHVLGVIAGDPEYVRLFKKAFGEPAKPKLVTSAIAIFEKTLVTENSPLDRYINGDSTALTSQQITGLKKFQKLGCISCHQGKGIGGNMFQRVGLAEDYFKLRGGKPLASDVGRYAVTGREEDRHVFKVPSLRNVESTAPYFHDGSARTLEEAVTTMARVQLGRRLSPEDIKVLVAFLKSLTGKIPATAFPLPTRTPAHAD